MKTFGMSRAPGGIGHIAVDLRIPNQMIVAGRHAISTTDGSLSTQIIAGSRVAGYREGVASQARFHTVSGFFQLSPSALIVLDRFNHCLRLIDRFSSATGPFVGQCSKSGYGDGTAAMFNEPYDIIRDTTQENQFFVSDRANNAIRITDLSNRNVSTLIKSDQIPKPKGMAYDTDSGSLYIIASCGVVMYNIQRRSLSVIVSPSSAGFADGSLTHTKMYYPKEIVLLSSTQLLISDPNNHRLRILDLITNTASSVCSGKRGYCDENLLKCNLGTPWSIHLNNSKLYIGDRKMIHMIEGK